MNRRSFFRGIGAIIGGVAINQAVRQWPFRVYSFPSIPTVPMSAWLFGFPYHADVDWGVWLAISREAKPHGPQIPLLRVMQNRGSLAVGGASFAGLRCGDMAQETEGAPKVSYE